MSLVAALFANAATTTTTSPHADVQAGLVRLFGLGPVSAGLIVLAITAFGALLADRLWSLAVWLYERRRYGGWQIRVSGGKSGRAWHMPLDIETVKALLTGRYVAFKRDLGTILSGEGTVDFTLGVPQDQPLSHAPPSATGLSIRHDDRLIEMQFRPSVVANQLGLMTTATTEKQQQQDVPGSEPPATAAAPPPVGQ